ncbi:MAG: TRAM domain-containing protein [Candidatus Aenigmarchaeota archaeon]|nr:TRAM domain-containing protein [Candidatus Aenigmarchaeota archaeon]
MERRFGKPRFDRDKRGGGFRDGGFRDGGGFRERRDDFPKPVNEGDEFDVEINEIGTKGDGIARVKNFVIFVPDTKEGEKCRIKITMVRPKFAVAEKIGKSQEKDIELKEPGPKVEEEAQEGKAEEPLEEDALEDEELDED